MTKQGGAHGGRRSWRKRWFVLKGRELLYFKNKKDAQKGEMKGVCSLTEESFVRPDKEKNKKFCFQLGAKDSSSPRVFYIYTDTQEEMDTWMKTLADVIDRIKNPNGNSKPTTTTTTETETAGSNGTGTTASATPSSSSPPELSSRLQKASQHVPFLLPDNNKFLEFWEMWEASVSAEVYAFEISITLDLNQTSWRCLGPQQAMIQNMVDFFWNVGAPDTEIDKLNDIGTLINPRDIGSWIDMSAKGGMDGGWFFPTATQLKTALEASDASHTASIITEWAEAYNVVEVIRLGRDMGAAPPRQTHFTFRLPDVPMDQQLETALAAYDRFKFPKPPDDMLEIIKNGPTGLLLQVYTCSQGFVKLGVLTPCPESSQIPKLCALSGNANQDSLRQFEEALMVGGVEFVEYTYLEKGYGYGVYKEGFNVIFHYRVEKDGKS